MVLNPSPNLLLIHDSGSLQKDYKEFFSNNGWNFDVASDFNSALDAAKNNSYEIIISDFDLPELSGQAFMDAVRCSKPNQAIMVVSSAAKAEEAVQALRSGAVDFLQKPIDYRFLQETIVRVVSCLRAEEAQYKILKCLTNYSAIYSCSVKDIGNIAFALPLLNEMHAAGIIDLNLKLKITLAFQEALANSLEHGNLELQSAWKDEFDVNGVDKFSNMKAERLLDTSYSERPISISCSYSEGNLSISIKDSGKGFDAPRGPLDFINDGSLLFYGRGLRIIFGTMDRVCYEDNGTKITVTKKIK
ncbi:MAG: response regulator [bacterium]|nr:response regulator [bacterium]